jgi:hypothetical protein
VCATKKNSSTSFRGRSSKQEAFEREARERLEHPDMGAFDRLMKSVIAAAKEQAICCEQLRTH